MELVARETHERNVRSKGSPTYALGLDAEAGRHAGEAGHAQEEHIEALARLEALFLFVAEQMRAKRGEEGQRGGGQLWVHNSYGALSS